MGSEFYEHHINHEGELMSELGPPDTTKSELIKTTQEALALRAALSEAQRERDEARERLRQLHDAFSCMPDAGLTADDPRWGWWHKTSTIRTAVANFLSEGTGEQK